MRTTLSSKCCAATLVISALALVACTTSVESPRAPTTPRGLEPDDAAARAFTPARPMVPDEATLCDIVFYQSREEDIQAILGPPDDTWGSTAGGEQSSYDFAGNANITFGFDDYTVYEAMMFNVAFPKCWDDEKQARIVAAEQPQMDSQL